MMAYNEGIQCILVRISILALFWGGVRLNGALHPTKKVTLSLESCHAFLESLISGFSSEQRSINNLEYWFFFFFLVGDKQGL